MPANRFQAARDKLRAPAVVPRKIKLAPLKKPPITAWSLSRLKLYEQCPLLARLKFVEKLPEPQGPAMERGDKIHKMIEAHLRYGTPIVFARDPLGQVAVHVKLKTFFEGLRKEFLKHNLNAECELAFDKDWQVTSWFDPKTGPPVVRIRTKADALFLPKRVSQGVVVYDWKSGKVREEEYKDTVEIYGISALAAGVGESASGSLVYTDIGEFRESAKPILLKDLPKLRKKWDARAEPMLKDTRFAPRPSDKCRWCSFSKSKGGPCQF